MTTETDDSRLGRLEGRMAEQSAAIQDLREGLREVRAEVRDGLRAVNARIDRLFLSSWAIGGGIIAALVVQIIRAG
jgi:uncharacterized coiled-coil protein SlyX